MRLTNPPAEPGAPGFAITFDGTALPARPGETVAGVLSAAGILRMRDTASGQPRGLHCGMGACHDCLVTIDGRASQRACMVKAQPGQDVRSDSAAPAAMAPPATRFERVCDVLVVGGGPAGLAAAAAAAEAGAHVVLLDERPVLGGQYFKPLANPASGRGADRQFRDGEAMRRRVAALGVEVICSALVWGAFSPDELAVVLPDAEGVFRPKRLILAPGAFERPMAMPGWTLPGVMTSGALQLLVRTQLVCPGQRVVIAGSGPLNLQLACELIDRGVEVAAVVEAAARPRPGDAPRALALFAASPRLTRDGLRHLARLRRAGVPLLWASRPLACSGPSRATGLHVATPQGERHIGADLVALHHGLLPDTQLARALGCSHAVADGVLQTVTDADGRTSLPAVFAVGDGARPGGAAIALARVRPAGLAAARDLGLAASTGRAGRHALLRAEAFQAALWRLFRAEPHAAPLADDVLVCRCEEVTAGTIRAAVAAGARGVAGVKRATRAGMGRCQGRFCATTVARFCGGEREAALSAPRAPLRPVPVASIRSAATARPAIIAAPAQTAWRGVADPPPVPGKAEAVVIGGGVVGLAVALFLARGGREVLVLDRAEAGMGASTANAGSLHVQLLAYDFEEGDPGPLAETLPLGPAAIGMWRDLARDAGEDLGLRTEGGLILGEDERDLAWLERKVAFERQGGIDVELIGPAEIARIAPELASGFVAAAWCPQEGQMDPLRGTFALRTLAERAGARVLEGAEVHALAEEGGGWRVTTSGGSIRCATVVNAAGPHAAEIGRLVGLALPVRGIIQQVVVTEPTRPLLRPLVAYARRHLSLKQGDAGHFLIGGGWPGTLGADGAARLQRTAIAGNLDIARRVLPGLDMLHVLRAWASLNIHLDRGPLIGPAPGRPGLFLAVTSNGATLAPAVGRIVADAVLSGTPVPRAFRLEELSGR